MPSIIRSHAVIALEPPALVVLLVGDPSIAQLNPLLCSTYLASSLFILATHNPPPLPESALPAVRIIRLVEPLRVENAGAVRLVSTLERAERVARIWRKHKTTGVVELAKNDDGAFLHIDPAVLQAPTEHKRRSKLLSTPATSSKALAKLLAGLPASDPAQRPFDALINFLPPDLADKSILKQAILVTTIGHPFLCATTDPLQSKTSTPDRRSRWSTLFARSQSQPAKQQPSPKHATERAHLIHVLPHSANHYHTPPPSRPVSFTNGLSKVYQLPDLNPHAKLVDSIDSFLLNFAYPEVDIDNTERAAPYLLPTSALGIKIPYAPPPKSPSPTAAPSDQTISILDIVILGLLEPKSQAQTPTQKQKRKQPGDARIWIESENNIVIVGDDGWMSSAGSRPTIASISPLSPVRGPRRRVSSGRVQTLGVNPPLAVRCLSSPNMRKPQGSVQMGRPLLPHNRSSSAPSFSSLASVRESETPKVTARGGGGSYGRGKTKLRVATTGSEATLTPPPTPPGHGSTMTPKQDDVPKVMVTLPTPTTVNENEAKPSEAKGPTFQLVTPPDTEESEEGSAAGQSSATSEEEPEPMTSPGSNIGDHPSQKVKVPEKAFAVGGREKGGDQGLGAVEVERPADSFLEKVMGGGRNKNKGGPMKRWSLWRSASREKDMRIATPGV